MKRQTDRVATTLSQLPSLDLLRGFVAVGRRMSITVAAQDLCLTQSAVSRQVRSLERILGVKLLSRGHRSIAFTTEGEQLFRGADSAIHQLQDVMDAIKRDRVATPVTITASVGVAGLWLLPRLGRFLERHPHIDVRISASNKLNDLQNEGLDIAVRYCTDEVAPPNAIRLFGETITPVAHPSLGLSGPLSAQDLEAQILLDYDGAYRPWLRWNDWLAKQGWEGLRPRALLRFNQYDQAIQAAIAGQGIALGRVELIAHALADGRLATVTMPQPGPTTPNAFWLIQRSSQSRAEVDDVIRWIKAEAATLAA